MNNQLLTQILEPNNNIYLGYKNSNYFTNTYIPNFEKLNKDNIKFTKEETRKLESRICTGKSKSILADSLYHKLDILTPLTQNNILTDKFILRIIDILKNYKLKFENTSFNFTWVLNLKKLGYNFTDDVLKDLKYLGFNSSIDLNNKVDSNEVELITYFLNFNTSQLPKIKEFFDKNNNIIPKLEHLKYFYSTFVTNYFDKNNLNYFTDLVKLYELLVSYKYQVSQEDVILFTNNIIIYIDKLYESYNIKVQLDIYSSINKFITIMNNNNVFFNQNDIKNFLKLSNLYKKNKYYFYSKYDDFIVLLNSILTHLIKDKNNNLTKFNYLEYLSCNTTLVSQSKPSFTINYKNLIDLISNNNLLNITDNCINKIILNTDTFLLDYLLDKNLIEPSENMMNYACMSNNLSLVKKLINYKFIPSIQNIYYIQNLSTSTYSRDILNFLLDNGLILDNALLAYLIKKNIKISDLEKYGLHTDEYKNMIEDICVRENKFPYETKIKYTDIFLKLANVDICEFEEILIQFDSNNKKIGLLNVLIKAGNIFLINYLKDKYPDIKPDLEVIHKTENAELYKNLFDLKIT